MPFERRFERKIMPNRVPGIFYLRRRPSADSPEAGAPPAGPTRPGGAGGGGVGSLRSPDFSRLGGWRRLKPGSWLASPTLTLHIIGGWRINSKKNVRPV